MKVNLNFKILPKSFLKKLFCSIIFLIPSFCIEAIASNLLTYKKEKFMTIFFLSYVFTFHYKYLLFNYKLLMENRL